MKKNDIISLVGIKRDLAFGCRRFKQGCLGVSPQTYFLDKNECWIWGGNINNNGYGRFKLNKKDYYAHRYSYEILKGKIPKGLEIDHLCRNRACFNPEHLEAVSHAENNRRGIGFSGLKAKQKVCLKGHPFTKINNRGERICQICKNLINKKYRLRKKNE